MSFLPFNDLARAQRFAPADAQNGLPWREASLFVCTLPVSGLVPPYVAALNFATIAQHPSAFRFENEPHENFYFEWRHFAKEPHHALANRASDFFNGKLPAGLGYAPFCEDMSKRAELYCSATRNNSAICQLRFSSIDLNEEFHKDKGYRYTSGTAYLNVATAFISLSRLKDMPDDDKRRAIDNPELAPHLRHPKLYDFYVFDAGRDHAVPQFKGNRLTLIMR